MNEAADVHSAPAQTTNAAASEAEAKLAAEEKAREEAREAEKRTKQFVNATALAPAPTPKTPSSELRERLAEKDAKGLLCPNSARRSARSKVLNTERQLSYVIRYRECLSCGTRFKTTES